MPALAELAAVVLDCAEPTALAEFYRKVTGWELTYSDDDYAYLGNGGRVQLGFQRVADYQPPGWPDPAKQAHLDLRVTDLAGTTSELLALGATRPQFQPGEGRWVVLADPAGHLFCLTTGE